MNAHAWLRSVVFCIVAFLCLCLTNFILWDDIHSLSRLTVTEMYEYEGNIDQVVLGSSYVVHAFVPPIADEVTGCNTYNAGTKLQAPDASYYFLKEILKYNDVSTVYMDCSHVIMSYFKESNYDRNSLISVYMKPSLNQLEFIGASGSADNYIKTYFPFLIKKNLNFPGTVKAKLTDAYKKGNYEYVTFKKEMYRGNGYVAATKHLRANGDFATIVDISKEYPVTAFSLKYLQKMVDLCKAKNIRLVLVTMPVPDEFIDRVDNMQLYMDTLSDFADKNGIEYHDYNLVKRDYCRLGMRHFADKEHLNSEGADVFTKNFSTIEMGLANGNLSYNEVFYPSLKEKLKNDPDDTLYCQKR